MLPIVAKYRGAATPLGADGAPAAGNIPWKIPSIISKSVRPVKNAARNSRGALHTGGRRGLKHLSSVNAPPGGQGQGDGALALGPGGIAGIAGGEVEAAQHHREGQHQRPIQGRDAA